MTARDLVLAWFDKALLGGAVLWLASAATALGAGPSDDAPAELERSLAALAEHMRGETVRPAPAPTWAADLAERLRAAPQAPATAPTWVLHRRPAFLFDRPPAAQPPAFVHTAATQVTTDAGERGRVVVRWTPGAFSYVLATCTVERRRGDDGPWELVAEVATTTRELIDEAVAPRARYAYRVTSVARADEDDLAVKAALAAGTFVRLTDDLARRESEPSTPVETPAEVFVVPLSVDVVPHRPAACSAYVVVHRWDRAARRFVSGRFKVKVGQRVGEGALDTGAELAEVGVDGATLWVDLRDTTTGEVERADSRRDRLPSDLK